MWAADFGVRRMTELYRMERPNRCINVYDMLTFIMGQQNHLPKGLDGRMRDQNGRIRGKQSNTLVRTLRETYGPDFAVGYRSDEELGTVPEKEGAESLSQLLKRTDT